MPVAALLVWFLAALAAGATGLVARMQPPLPQALLISLTALTLIATVAVPAVKTWVDALPLESLVALHLARFVGIYFLVLYGRGLLPFEFAVLGGWGDIAVATAALALLVFAQPLAARPRLVFAWNVVGLFDIVFVVLTAVRLTSRDPHSMGRLLLLPLSLLPTFLVPLIVASHILILARLRGATRPS
jgi:hypothetical protein